MPPSVHSLEPIDVQGEPQLGYPSNHLPPELPPDSEAGRAGIVRKIIVLLVVLGVVGFAAWKIHGNLGESTPAAGGRARGSGDDRAVPVTTAAVQQKTMPIYLTALGTV